MTSRINLIVDMAKCQQHAQCCYIVPDVFELDADGRLVVRETSLPIGLLDDLESAVDACPVQAISVEVTDA